MDTFEAITTRHSIRRYTDEPVSEDDIMKIIEAGSYAPSACNRQPWHFIVVDDADILLKCADINPHASMAQHAPCAILVCADMKTQDIGADYWIIDCAAAIENMLLAINSIGLGAVWTGICPRKERMDDFSNLFELPESIKPHSLIVLGHPAEHGRLITHSLEGRVHRNRFT